MVAAYILKFIPTAGSSGASDTVTTESKTLFHVASFPAVQIDEARTLRNAFSAMLADGINPSAHIKAERAMQAIPVAQARFTLDSDGALSFRLASRRLALTPAETLELRTCLDATRAVIPKETSCP